MIKRLFTTLLILILALFGWYFQAIQPVTRQNTGTVTFEIQSGWPVDKVIQELSQNQLIRSRTATKITILRLGLASKIQAGFFELSPNMSATEIASSLTKGRARELKVTIPEGLRRQEIAKILQDTFSDVDGTNFDVNQFLSATANLEGTLFPDTYNFSPKASTEDIVERLTSRYNQVIVEISIPQNQISHVTILASLLERESANSDEMPDVAGVLQNRLDAKWPLQVDATVQFALASSRCKKIDCDWWPQTLSRTDIESVSAFNTYQNQGLPPSPIANPGKSALKAAFSPNTNPYWFYIHDPKGQIHFSKTIEEHNQNICTYLKKDCN